MSTNPVETNSVFHLALANNADEFKDSLVFLHHRLDPT